MIPPVTVSFGEFNQEFLFDLSEGGLAVYGRKVPRDWGTFPVRFHLPGESGPITTQGEIAWTSKSKNRTGVRFVRMSNEARSQLRDWMKARLPPAPPYPAEFTMDRQNLVSRSIAAVREAAWRPSHLGLSAIVVTVLIVALFVGFKLNRSHAKPAQNAQRAGAVAAMPRTLVAPTPDRLPDTSSPASPPPLSQAPQIRGFVLQLAAVKYQRDADALSNSIREKALPVIVFRSKSDALYRVLVGPYADMPAAIRMRNKLKAEGFQSFVRSSLPE